VLIWRSTSLVEGLVAEVVFDFISKVDQDFFDGFGENVTFFLVKKVVVVEGWDWLIWTC
jgi:hypothetical protein